MAAEIFIKIAESLQYSFIQRAIIAGSFIAASCSFLGVFLILRRFALIGDGLSHVSLATIAIGLLAGLSPIYVSIPLVMLASLWILKLAERSEVHGDTAIGMVSSIGIAAGVIIASIAGGYNVDLFSYLFGSILAINEIEVWLSIGLSITVILVIILFYHDLFSITFDEEFARASGINAGAINKILVMLTALTVVLSIRVVGTMLVSSLIIFPGVTALQLKKSFKSTIIYASFFGVFSVIIGTFISYLTNMPTGATIVLVNFLCFSVVYFLKFTKSPG